MCRASTPSPSMTRVTAGSLPASAESGIVIVHQTTVLAPAASVEGAEQVADQPSSGSSIVVVGRQVEVPSFTTSQARSKPVLTGCAPTPSG